RKVSPLSTPMINSVSSLRKIGSAKSSSSSPPLTITVLLLIVSQYLHESHHIVSDISPVHTGSRHDHIGTCFENSSYIVLINAPVLFNVLLRVPLHQKSPQCS